MAKEILLNKEAREVLKKGIDQVCDVVKVTLGPKGRNVAIKVPYQLAYCTKDGVTVARNISLKNPIENVGAEMIIDVALKTVWDAGDGTTTATVLAQAIIAYGIKLIDNGVSPVELKRQIDAAVNKVINFIKASTIKISDGMLEQVATISANGDKEVGKLVAEAFDKVGGEGKVTVEESNTSDTKITVVNGLRVNRGFVSPFCVNNLGKAVCEMESVYIFICDKTITSEQELFYIFDLGLKKIQNGKLLIICNDLDAAALGSYNNNRQKSNIPVCVIPAPWGDDKADVLKDISIATGATIIGDMYGTEVLKSTVDDLGRCSKIVVTKDESLIIGGLGDKDLLAQRLMELRTAAIDAKGIQLNSINDRIARLTSGVAVIHVGGNSQIEMKERFDRCDDAVRATKCAIEEGVVAGGGVCLLRAKQSLQLINDGERLIGDILNTPVKQILLNAGEDADNVIINILAGEGNYGYNVATEEYGDMIEMGVIDPAKVVRVSLVNAASIAGTILTSEALMVEEPQKQ
jgi:chaperonin GroEL